MEQLQDLTVGEIANFWPESLKVFERYRIDICCGSRLPLAQVARKHGIDLDKLIKDLEAIAPILR